MNTRAVIIQAFIILTIIILTVRLFYIQIVDEQYQQTAESNIVSKIVNYPYRGLIYDRHGKLIVHNEPVYDLMIVPKEIELEDSTEICQLLGLSHQEFTQSYQKARRYSPILPSLLIGQLSNEDFAKIQDKIIQFDGLSIQPRTVRGYAHPSLSNALGYVGEITRRQLTQDSTKYYKSGDLIGISGVEKQYENVLRGKRGVSFKIVNVQGQVMGSYRDGEFDSLPVPGEDLHLTIDLELQQYAEKLMAGKVGSLVAINPNNGEILAFVSSPSYDPNLLKGRRFSSNYSLIASDTLNPLFARPIQAMYPPGSMFKTIQSLIALQEKVITPNEIIQCETGLIGDLAPPGKYDVIRAITLSSNTYYYKVFRRMIQQNLNESAFIDSRLGYDKWRNYAMSFALGKKVGIDIPNENNGSIPSIQLYDRIYGVNRWKFSNIYSLSIGQGEILVTPLQMANLGAILANKGHYYTPHIVKRIGNAEERFIDRIDLPIDSIHFEPVIQGMEQVISMGSGRRAYIRDLIICGKTSTVQNPQGEDHSGFMGFAPRENPQIAVAVYVENAGWGGRAAGSTASLLIEKYVRGYITRPTVEAYVIKGDFADAKRTTDQSN